MLGGVRQNRQLSNSSNPEEPPTVPEELQLYTVWKVFSMSDEQMKYPGQTPRQIIENLIYYYTDPITEATKPDDVPIVLDPMAGSGIVGEVCKKMFRRYVLFDLKPINPETIHQGDSMIEIKMPEQTVKSKIAKLVVGKGQLSKPDNPEEPQPYTVPELSRTFSRSHIESVAKRINPIQSAL
ncbi:site-specific DNA-methyltransferase [Candidatus Methanoperedens nitratireducens]|uniref:site-specific DNA-methyltransferase n=1 Tax=Candidatus Methanoperedens nitratireducens TaxID=1392998 RepID=UPI00211C7180|nr:site-specific DNA-methyltransferase [Candidatus Methanoperedens nitroreducens]